MEQIDCGLHNTYLTSEQACALSYLKTKQKVILGLIEIANQNFEPKK